MTAVIKAPTILNRRSVRLKGYDYTQPGAYFVTVCVRGRECMLGQVIDDQMVLNEAGRIVDAAWRDLPNHYPQVGLDAFVVMPNHVHGIIVLNEDTTSGVGAGFKPAPTGKPTKRHGLPEVVRGFKTFSARRINEYRDTTGSPFWQRNYYEHIIDGDDQMDRIREYINNNPYAWETDEDNPLFITTRR
jgi:putative transposase